VGGKVDKLGGNPTEKLFDRFIRFSLSILTNDKYTRRKISPSNGEIPTEI
jgi:hypothetical protein